MILQVFITGTNEIIDITSKYVSQPPGRVTTVYLSLLDVVSDDDIKDILPKNRKCKFGYENEGIYSSHIYSYNLCRIDCRIKLCMQYCNCTPYYYVRRNGEYICNTTGLYCLSKHAGISLCNINQH